MTRRQFLHHLGAAGGGAVACRAMTILGLLQSTSPASRRLDLAHTGAPKGTRVLVLGGGLAGLCAAYELTKLGYDCHVLEARNRPGGRCVTIRRGDVQTEIDGKEQVAHFDDRAGAGEAYFNAGPPRFPQDHLTVDYCRELGVAIEPFVNVNDAAYHCAGDAKPVRLRDARDGRAPRRSAPTSSPDVSELLAKVSDQDQLDQPLSRDEREALLELLRGGGMGGDPRARELVMFQVAGGVDRLAHALAERFGAEVVYGARVTEIRQRDGRVVAHYVDRLQRPREASGDYCVCTVPPPVLCAIPADFSDAMRRAIADVRFGSAAKIGLQFRRRFWEEDDKIFGGISTTDTSITQIIYPSCGWLGRNGGVLVGCYNYGDDARRLGAMRLEQRIDLALAEGERLHPQYRREFVAGVSMVWERIPFTLGAWSAEGRGAKRLREPDGRIYLAGEHLTMMGGWMAGALESARQVVEAIHARVQRG